MNIIYKVVANEGRQNYVIIDPMMVKKLLKTVLFVSIILHFTQCKKTEDNHLNLLDSDITFKHSSNARARYKQLVKVRGLSKFFKQSQINYFYPKNPWMGRIKANEVSYHALFSVDQFRAIWALKSLKADGILFSIFHPDNSPLTYNIILKHKGSEEKIFELSFQKKTFYDGNLVLTKKYKEPIELIFETRGEGVGAWINPRLNHIKKNPSVVLIIMLDTLRYDHTSIFGYHRQTTPFLEKLCSHGINFRNAYSTSSWTLPAHVSLFTGLDLSQHGVIGPQDTIDQSHALVAEVYQKNGYVTAAFTGGGFVEDSYGFYRGFQYYSNAPGNVFSMNSAERVFRHFKNYCRRFQGNDLFIFLHTYQMHAPYKAPHYYIDKINKNVKDNLLGISNFIKNKQGYYKSIPEDKVQLLKDLYDASILYTDEVLTGKVIDFLKNTRLYDNAFIVVLSDHGEEFFDHGSWEHGHTLYNELIRIPLVIKYPFTANKISTGVNNSLVSISDIPGLLIEKTEFSNTYKEMFKNKIRQDHRVLPVLFPESPIIKQFPPKFSLVDNNYHFIYNRITRQSLNFFDPSPFPQQLQRYELYDRRDSKERNNLFKKNIKVSQQFREDIKTYLKKIERIRKRKKRGKLDKDLQQKLKSLGYLEN
jgi:hypothetical protein